MKAVRVQQPAATLLDSAAPAWRGVPAEELAMGGTPLHLQPSRYVRTAWAGKPLGAVRSLTVQAAHNGHDLAFRLEWRDATGNTSHGDGTVFPDAAGVLFPVGGDAPLATMGSPDAPVSAWFWRANLPPGQGLEVLARGLGTVEPAASGRVQARGRWSEGAWSVVIARPLAANGSGGVDLIAGRTVKAAFGAWDGSRQERAGLKSFSKQWVPLEIAD